MIQRIQTLWLILASCSMALCLILPTATYEFVNMPTEGQTVEARLDLFAHGADAMDAQMLEPVVHYSQHMTGMATWPLVTLALLSIVLSVGCIFLYRRRNVQVRFVGLNLLLSTVYAFLVAFWAVDHYADLLSQGMGGAEPAISWSVGTFAPMFAMLFLFLAQRAIKKDEALVRAADRLR